MDVSRPLYSVREAMRDLGRDGRGWILSSIAAGWLLSLGVRLIYPVLLPYLRVEFGLTLGSAGLLLTLLWLAYAVGQFPAGLLTDRIGEKRTLVASTVISALSLVLLVTSTSWRTLAITTMIYGLGTALYGVARFTITSSIYPDRDGLAIGVTMAAGEVGNATLPPVAGLLAATFAWQFGFGFAIPLFVCVAAALWINLPERDSEPTARIGSFSPDAVRSVLSVLTGRSVYTVFVIQVLAVSIWQAFTGFYPTYLIEVKGMSPTFATLMFGVFFAIGVVVQLVAGNVYDRLGVRRSLSAVLAAMVVPLLLLPFATSRLEFVLVTLLLSAIPGYGTITMAYLTREIPPDVGGTALGTIRAGYISIGATSPLLFGLLADRGHFDGGFFLLAVLAGVAMVFALTLPEGRLGGQPG